MSDNVDHPSHYCDGRKYEPVEVILDWELDFLLGNALKYISRTGRKGSEEDAIEDLEKAVWYIRKRIDVLRAGSGKTGPSDDDGQFRPGRVRTATPSTIDATPRITCDTADPKPVDEADRITVVVDSNGTRVLEDR